MVASVALHSLYSLFTQELIEKLFHGILMYYINMGAAQFLRDYRRASLVKKSTELRKRVLQRNKKTKEKTDCVPYKVKKKRFNALEICLKVYDNAELVRIDKCHT